MKKAEKTDYVIEDQVLAAAKKRKKIVRIIVCVSVLVALAVGGYLVYQYAYKAPMIEKGKQANSTVDLMAMNGTASDSTLCVNYENIADKYKFEPANYARYQAAVYAYNMGDYQKALNNIEKYEGKDNVIAAMALCLKGDCLVNLDRNSDALSAFNSAISKCDGNHQLMPYLLSKKAVVLSALGRHADAAATYKTIQTNYPNNSFANTQSRMLQEEGWAEALSQD